MNKPLIYADYHKTDDSGRLILTCYGTVKDFKKHSITLQNGLALIFYMDDADAFGNTDNLLVDGIVEYDEREKRWVAEIDRATFRHASEHK